MRSAIQEETTMFVLMGQAMLGIQVLEECLSVSITLKTDVGYPYKVPKVKADEILQKRRRYTLGQAIKEAAQRAVYQDALQVDLENFLDQRNWLVHKSIDSIYDTTTRASLLVRLKYIAVEARKLQRALEDDLINFSEGHGLDMSGVKAAIKAYTNQS